MSMENTFTNAFISILVLRFLYFKKFLILIKADFEFEPPQPFSMLAFGETIQAGLWSCQENLDPFILIPGCTT